MTQARDEIKEYRNCINEIFLKNIPEEKKLSHLKRIDVILKYISLLCTSPRINEMNEDQQTLDLEAGQMLNFIKLVRNMDHIAYLPEIIYEIRCGLSLIIRMNSRSVINTASGVIFFKTNKMIEISLRKSIINGQKSMYHRIMKNPEEPYESK